MYVGASVGCYRPATRARSLQPASYQRQSSRRRSRKKQRTTLAHRSKLHRRYYCCSEVTTMTVLAPFCILCIAAQQYVAASSLLPSFSLRLLRIIIFIIISPFNDVYVYSGVIYYVVYFVRSYKVVYTTSSNCCMILLYINIYWSWMLVEKNSCCCCDCADSRKSTGCSTHHAHTTCRYHAHTTIIMLTRIYIRTSSLLLCTPTETDRRIISIIIIYIRQMHVVWMDAEELKYSGGSTPIK